MKWKESTYKSSAQIGDEALYEAVKLGSAKGYRWAAVVNNKVLIGEYATREKAKAALEGNDGTTADSCRARRSESLRASA